MHRCKDGTDTMRRQEVYFVKMSGALRPFWIYWGVLMAGCILFFICPLLIFLFFPVAFIAAALWLVIVYIVGNAVQRRSGLEKMSRRLALAFVCSFSVIMIFPVCSWVYELFKWNELRLSSLLNNFKDAVFWIGFVLHFFCFWIGEEVGKGGEVN